MAGRMYDDETLPVKHNLIFVLEHLHRVQALLVLAITAAAEIDAIDGLDWNTGGCEQPLEYVAIIGTANHRGIPLVHVHVGSGCFGHQPGQSEMIGMRVG